MSKELAGCWTYLAPFDQHLIGLIAFFEAVRYRLVLDNAILGRLLIHSLATVFQLL